MRKKFTMLLATFLVCLGGVKAETVITDLEQLTDGMECIISTSGRGGWAVKADGSSFGSTNDCGLGTTVDATKDQQIFQFKKSGDSFYLYSTYAQKYVNKDKTLSENAKDAIYFITETGVVNTFIVKFDDQHIINIGGSNQIVISGWGDISDEYDDGNRVTITNATESLKNSLSNLVTSAEETTENLNGKVFSELTTLVESINKAITALEGTPTRTVLKEKIAELTNAKAAAEAYPFVPSLLKEIEPSRYFIYYTDENNTKHYLQTTGANSVVTVTENPISYDIQAGTTEAGKFTMAYTIKMNGLYISNTSNDATNIETKDQVQLWSSQVVFEMNGKSAIRLTNATAENTWHGHYFINKGDENTTIASDPSLGENLFIWTIELDLHGMRDELAVLKEKATTLKTQLTNKLEGSAPIEEAVITALSTAIEYAETNKDSNNSEILNTGITQLNDAINNASVNAFGSGVLAMLDEGEYIIYCEKGNTKYYLSNDKTHKKVVTSTSPLVYDVYKGQTNGYATYAYCLDMNESKMSNPNGDMQIQVENKGGNNYNNNREWDSQVLYVNSQGKYAIRSTNCSAGSGWNSDAFITISEDGTTVSGQNTDLSDALYIWNIKKVNAEASINNVKYETLTAAIAAADPGATVTMLRDIEVSGAVEVTKDLTIDMNGKTLTSDGDGFEVKAGGTLTITGNGTVNAGTEGGLWVAVWANGGNAVIENGTYSVVAGEEGSTNDCIYAKGGEITINGGTFRNNGTYYPNKGGVVINANNTIANSKVIINGGTFNPAEGCVPYEVADVEAGRIELNTAAKVGNQYYTSLEDAIADAKDGAIVTLLTDITLNNYIDIRKEVTINLNEHSITHPSTSTATYKDVFEVYTNGRLTIVGDGSVIAEDGYSIYATGDAIVNINGGYYFSSISVIDARKDAQVTINGGTFKVDGSNNPDGDYGQKYTLNLRDKEGKYESDKSQIIVKGGEFYKYNPAVSESEPSITNFVAVGYSSINEGDFYVVSQGIKNELALKAAIAAAEAGTTVTLDKDIELSDAITIDNDITLDLGGKTITRAEGYVFEVTGELTVTGEGSIAEGGICYIINDADYKTEAGKTYAISEDKVNVDIQYTRTFGHTNWQVLFVPFDIPLESMTDFEVYGFTEMNDENTAIIVEKVTGNLNAHTPYFIKANKTGEKTITVTNAKLEATTAYEHNYGNYTLHGTYTSMAIQDHREYVLSNGQWVQMENAGSPILGAFRLYLTANNGNDAPALRIVTRGETGIEELSTVNDQQSTVIYDLTGRKVETMDKGIYIVNGRKVVIK